MEFDDLSKLSGEIKVEADDLSSLSNERKMEFDDQGDRVLCTLSVKRFVALQNFKRMKLVSIREYYKEDGKMHPSRKGISLTVDQWKALKESMPAVDEAIKKMEEQ